jgi:hypothetical protein
MLVTASSQHSMTPPPHHSGFHLLTLSPGKKKAFSRRDDNLASRCVTTLGLMPSLSDKQR